MFIQVRSITSSSCFHGFVYCFSILGLHSFSDSDAGLTCYMARHCVPPATSQQWRKCHLILSRFQWIENTACRLTSCHGKSTNAFSDLMLILVTQRRPTKFCFRRNCMKTVLRSYMQSFGSRLGMSSTL